MLKRALLICGVALLAESLQGQQLIQIDPQSQPAVEQIAAVTRAIKQCPRQMSSEKQWGKKPNEIERWYIGPPQNVVWDVVQSNSIRSPYVGYIEFSLPEDYWVPDEVKDKFEKTEESSSAELAHALGGPMKHRYEFDLGPKGLELTKMLHGNKTEMVDDRPDDTCWQKAARNAESIPQTVPPGYVAVPIGFATSCAVELSGKFFLSWCDNENDAQQHACKDWLHGFYKGFSSGNGAMTCSRAPTDDELLDAVVKYIKEHPKELDQPTSTIVSLVLHETFSCK